MALRAKVLRKKAEKFEAKQLQVHKVDKERLSAVEPLLQDVFFIRRPKPNDYEVRRDLVRVFNAISKEIHGNSKKPPVVVEFGSFVMDLFSVTSDLDLSVNFDSSAAKFPREKKIQTLRKFAKKLYALQSKGHVYGVLPITTAKVPIVKVVDRGTGVECDISVENRDGILKSKIIHIISSIDERFHKLSFLMKNWAKAQNINSSKEKTLNSLSIILLVAFHLQTRNPPILPPFSELFKDGTEAGTVVKSVANFVDYGKSNKESLAELFLTLLIKLFSVEKLWRKGICASTCEGCWISKTWDSKVARISVEDFTNRSQNVARAVGPAEVVRINKCIEISIEHVFSFLDGKFSGLTLKELLFGQDNIPRPLPRENPKSHQLAALPKKNPKSHKLAALPQDNPKSHELAPLPQDNPKSHELAALRRDNPKSHELAALPRENPKSHELAALPRENPKSHELAALLRENPKSHELAALPQDNPKSHELAALPGNSSQLNPGSTVKIKKKRKRQTTAVIIKKEKMVAAQNATLSVPINLVQRTANWGGTYVGTPQPTTGGWMGAQQAPATSWGAFQQPRTVGWVGARLPTDEVWTGAQPSMAGGWEMTQPPRAGDWEMNQPPRAGGWEMTQPPRAGGWEMTQPPRAGGWEMTQPPRAGGWEMTQPPTVIGLRGVQHPARQWERAQPSTGGVVGAQHPAGVWVRAQPTTGSVVGAQKPITRTWGGTSYHLWTNPNTRNF